MKASLLLLFSYLFIYFVKYRKKQKPTVVQEGLNGDSGARSRSATAEHHC